MRRRRSSEDRAKPSKVARTRRELSKRKKVGEKAKEEDPLHVVLERQAMSGPSAAGADAVGPLVDLIVGALDVEDPSSRLPALLSAHRVFIHFQERGTLAKQQKWGTDEDNDGTSPLDAYRRLVANQHRLFLEAVLEWLHLEDDICRVAALRCLFAQGAAPGRKNLDEALLSRTVTTVMTGGVASMEVLAVLLTEKVLKHGDVALLTLHALRRSLISIGGMQTGDGKNGAADEDKEINKDNGDDNNHDGDKNNAVAMAERRMVARNVHAVLSRMPMPPPDHVLSSPLLSNERSHRDLSAAWRDASSHKRAHGVCWLTLLSMRSLSRSMYVKLLSQVPKLVLPHLTNPLALSDFLIDSYNLGGEASMLALDGLWTLIRDHGLDYPDFFPRLYALLTPSIFHSENRSRFFAKVALFLRSSRLPIYTVASFIKRLARLCLAAPPDGVLYALPMVFRLMCAHKGCVVLVHRDPSVEGGRNDLIEDVASSSDDSDDSNDSEGDTDESDIDSKGVESGNRKGEDGDEVSLVDAAAWRGKDTFRPDECNPQKSGALGSSLWEIAALQAHYHPGVVTVAKMFNQHLSTNHAVAVDDFIEQDYASLFHEAMGRRVKRVPLEFRAPAFSFS